MFLKQEKRNKGKPTSHLKAHRYLKNSVSKSISHVIKHNNFQLYRVYPDGVLEDLEIDDNFVNKRVRLYIHQTRYLSKTWREEAIAGTS